MNEYIEQLIRIYNTLFEISTKGEDTLVMADCLRAFKDIISKLQDIEFTSPEKE